MSIKDAKAEVQYKLNLQLLKVNLIHANFTF